jgi:hypothetical protein
MAGTGGERSRELLGMIVVPPGVATSSAAEFAAAGETVR